MKRVYDDKILNMQENPGSLQIGVVWGGQWGAAVHVNM